VERYFGWEILDHSPQSVRLDRIGKGGPLLVDHDRTDLAGVIEGVSIGSDRKGRAVARFGRSARAEEIYNDVLDGIRANVSVGYRIHNMILEKEENGVSSYRATDWEPLEISLVSIPADISVGIGRNGYHGTQNEKEFNTNQKTRLHAMNLDINVKEERTRVSEIMAIGQRQGLLDDALEFVRLGKSLEEFRAMVIEKLSNATPLNIQPASTGSSGPFRSLGEQLQAVAKASMPGKREDPRLHQVRATGLNETVPSEGGFLVQQEFGQELLQDAIETGELARRCRKQPIGPNANGIKIPGVDETSRADGSRFGGVLSYWIAESGEKQKSKPKFRQIDLSLKKNVVLVYTSDELLSDSQALDGFLRETCPKEISFSADDAIVRGTGAGMPLGILNAGCLVTVSKETGQAKDTIIGANVLNMVKRTLGKTSNYVWLYNKECLDQIYSLSMAAGIGDIPLFLAAGSLPNQPENRLLGLPLIECEQCSALGDAGDLILADLGNGYILADKGGVDAAVSIHVQFIYDESVYRFVYRCDGQPVRASALTPFKGSAGATQSHFIVLQERA
jgi:HK97 family phage major capsid protein